MPPDVGENGWLSLPFTGSTKNTTALVSALAALVAAAAARRAAVAEAAGLPADGGGTGRANDCPAKNVGG